MEAVAFIHHAVLGRIAAIGLWMACLRLAVFCGGRGTREPSVSPGRRCTSTSSYYFLPVCSSRGLEEKGKKYLLLLAIQKI